MKGVSWARSSTVCASSGVIFQTLGKKATSRGSVVVVRASVVGGAVVVESDPSPFPTIAPMIKAAITATITPPTIPASHPNTFPIAAPSLQITRMII